MWEWLEQREIRRRGQAWPATGGRPRPDLPEGTDLIPEIKHIVVLMMENHSYDNYLGTLAGRGDGLPLGPDGAPDGVNPLAERQRVAAHHLTSTIQVDGDPTQTWNASHLQYDGRALRRLRRRSVERRARRRPGRADGLLDRARTCRSTTGWRARSRWPTAGSAPAWGRRSRTGGS